MTKGDTAFIWRTGAIMLGVSAIQALGSMTAVYFGAKAAMAFGRDVRGALFHKVMSFSARELNKFGAPSLITRNTNDVQQVQMLVLMSCTMLLSRPDHDDRRHRDGDPRGRRTVLAGRRRGAAAGRRGRR